MRYINLTSGFPPKKANPIHPFCVVYFPFFKDWKIYNMSTGKFVEATFATAIAAYEQASEILKETK